MGEGGDLTKSPGGVALQNSDSKKKAPFLKGKLREPAITAGRAFGGGGAPIGEVKNLFGGYKRKRKKRQKRGGPSQ